MLKKEQIKKKKNYLVFKIEPLMFIYNLFLFMLFMRIYSQIIFKKCLLVIY